MANQLLATYYEDRLMDPPKPLVVTPRPKLYVYIYGDSSLAFVEKKTEGGKVWWQDTRQTCDEELKAALRDHGYDGNVETFYYKKYGQPTSSVLQAIEGSQKYINKFERGAISVGIASCMLNELCE